MSTQQPVIPSNVDHDDAALRAALSALPMQAPPFEALASVQLRLQRTDAVRQTTTGRRSLWFWPGVAAAACVFAVFACAAKAETLVVAAPFNEFPALAAQMLDGATAAVQSG